MLTKVTLKNFQAHKHLELELGKFTTLTGGSNGGKSAVLRAITALVKNESANDYVRYGQKSLSVRLSFSDGYEVEWIKGGGENKYILTKPDGLEQVFDKVGADVPDEVREVLRLGPIFVKGGDKEYVNFHNQLEAPFLISTTAGNVAKLFGELTSASKLYAAVGEGNKRVKSTNALRTTRVRDVRAVKDALNEFNDLSLYEDCLSHAKDLLDAANTIEESVAEIESLCYEHSLAASKVDKAETIVLALSKAASIDLQSAIDGAQAVSSLAKIIDDLATCDASQSKLNNAITYLNGSINTDLKTLLSCAAEVSDFSDVLSAVAKVSNEIQKLTNEVNGLGSDLQSLDEEMTELFSALESCPTCKQELTEDAKLHVLDRGSVHAAH